MTDTETPARPRCVLLVDGPHAGELLTVPDPDARVWTFADCLPVTSEPSSEWRYTHTTYHFHECAFLDRAILIGTTGRDSLTPEQLAKHVLSTNAKRATIRA
jgi:hypothetical protein